MDNESSQQIQVIHRYYIMIMCLIIGENILSIVTAVLLIYGYKRTRPDFYQPYLIYTVIVWSNNLTVSTLGRELCFKRSLLGVHACQRSCIDCPKSARNRWNHCSCFGACTFVCFALSLCVLLFYCTATIVQTFARVIYS
jgi:hypothetical protein